MRTLYDRPNAPCAPNPAVQDTGGKPVQLADMWRAAELTAFVFTRHFG